MKNEQNKQEEQSKTDEATTHYKEISKSTPDQSRNKKIYKKCTGIENEPLSISLLATTWEAFPKNFSKEDAGQIAVLAMHELSPRDALEGMLCSQIVALDAQGMRYLARAESDENWLCHTEAAVNMAIKLLRLKNETIEALTRYRRKGEQKVVVQHIQMNDQSKAIIGDVSQQGGGGNV